MADDLKSLQELWQRGGSGAPDALKLLHQLNALRRKHRMEKIGLFVSLLTTMAVLLFILPVVESPYFAAAMVFIGLAVVLILWQAYQIRFQPLNGARHLSNKAFLESYLQNMEKKVRFTRKTMWVYAILLTLGLNLAYLEAIRSIPTIGRVLIHLGMSTFLILGFRVLIQKRLRTYQQEIDPLLKTLRDLNAS
ncbi:MAG: hypothetical protein GXO78_04440 [Calditrichaeota bacterium]|nr:hypothetical protein [Calditrichota bacterium]